MQRWRRANSRSRSRSASARSAGLRPRSTPGSRTASASEMRYLVELTTSRRCLMQNAVKPAAGGTANGLRDFQRDQLGKPENNPASPTAQELSSSEQSRLDFLRSIFCPSTPEGRLYRIRVRTAQRDASVCASCERAIGADEPVYRQRFSMGRCLTGYSTRLAPICSSCCVHKHLYGTTGRACVGCGRPVHNLHDLIYRRHRFCSEVCQSKAVAAVARDRRRQKRGLTRCCDQCGESYEPNRADALFCSGACRQKAYRQRSLRVTSLYRDATSDTRNAGSLRITSTTQCAPVDTRNADGGAA